MEHPLDNPVWHALTGPHSTHALGSLAARHYPRDMAPFSAIREPTAEAYADLATGLPRGVEARLFRPADEPAPAGWEIASRRPIIQMVAEKAARGPNGFRFEVLGPNDVEEMLALAEVARPGPFERRAVFLGHYAGYREGDRLLAMGGERFCLPEFVELSAISVHPDARGRGLGAAITAYLAERVLAVGKVPFLHVFPDNPALSLYQRLGFRERKRLWVLWRAPQR